MPRLLIFLFTLVVISASHAETKPTKPYCECEKGKRKFERMPDPVTGVSKCFERTCVDGCQPVGVAIINGVYENVEADKSFCDSPQDLMALYKNCTITEATLVVMNLKAASCDPKGSCAKPTREGMGPGMHQNLLLRVRGKCPDGSTFALQIPFGLGGVGHNGCRYNYDSMKEGADYGITESIPFDPAQFWDVYQILIGLQNALLSGLANGSLSTGAATQACLAFPVTRQVCQTGNFLNNMVSSLVNWDASKMECTWVNCREIVDMWMQILRPCLRPVPKAATNTLKPQ